MTKQEYILKFLEKIDKNIFTIADDIKALIEKNNISDELIDTIVNLCTQAVQSTTNKKTQAQLQKWISFLTKIKEQEAQSNIEDQKDINELEAMLDNI